MRQVLGSPQDFSLTDGAGNDTGAIYQALGARISPLYSFNWVRLLRPFQTARSLFDYFGGIFPALKTASGIVTVPLDFLLSKAPVGMLREPRSPLVREPAAAAELLECIREAQGREALKPAYAMPSFAWLISQARTGPGRDCLRTVIARDANGTRCGWFVYHAFPGRPAFVLSLGCCRKSQFKDVLLALFQDAWEQGSSAVKGQAIPEFLTTLTEQYCLFREPYSCVIGHSRDPEIMTAFQGGDMTLTRLDSGAWLRMSSEALA